MLETRQKIFLARLVQMIAMGARRMVGLGATSRVTRHGVHWELDLGEGIDFSIWLLGSFEPETVRCYERMVKPGGVVLDIGANIGAHTLLLAKATGANGRVIAFEPTDYAFSKLTRNVSLNPELAGRIHCLQLMLGDADVQDSPAPSLYSSWPLKDEAGLHHLHQGRLMTTAGAAMRTLDSTIVALGVDRVDCIKLDIDGAECSMMRGARQVLTRFQPPIIMELAPYVLEERGASLGELIHLLTEYGYGLFDASTGRPLTMDPVKLNELIPSGASLNVVARPAAGSSQS